MREETTARIQRSWDADPQLKALLTRRAIAERQFNDRLSAYREMIALRGTADGLSERIGRTLLLMSGAGRMGKEDLDRQQLLRKLIQ